MSSQSLQLSLQVYPKVVLYLSRNREAFVGPKKQVSITDPGALDTSKSLLSAAASFPQLIRSKNQGMGGGTIVTATKKALGVSSKSKLEEQDGVVIVDHGSRRAQSNAMLHEFVQMYKEETGHKVVEAAHMELAVPTIGDAFDRCVEQGATRIIISPYFLFPGRHWDKDIPALAAEAAAKHPEVSYLVTAPIGLHELMVTVIQDRMEYCLRQVDGEVSECDMCKGTGRCKQIAAQDLHSGSDALASSKKDVSEP